MAKRGVQEQFDEIEKNKGWQQALLEIKRTAEANAREEQFTTTEAKKITNVKLNRYNDVVPYDHCRVQLRKKDFDYINANIVRCEMANRKYILCQGPLPGTVHHFWLMVWEQNSQAILMLNKLIEERHVKCHLYWPEKVGDIMDLGPEIGLIVEYLHVENYTNFYRRTFKITDVESTKSREVIQFHYTKWPDFGIPQSPTAFLKFLKHVRAAGVLEESVGPAIVHCSAGIGRSGTFCLVDSCLIIVDKFGEDKLSLREVLLELRKYRMGLIQTGDQLYFSYLAVLEGKKYLKNHTLDQLDDEQIADGDEAGDPDRTSSEDNEEPPKIPPRSHSLTGPKLGDDAGASNHHNTEQITTPNFTNRPLPPLPGAPTNNNKNNNSSDDDDGSDDDNDDDEEEISSLDTSEEERDNDPMDEGQNSDKDVPEIQRDDDSPSSPTNEDGNSTELRRRIRSERKENMEDKIQQIKRKQRETEEGAISAKKRRQNIRAK